MVSVDYSIFKAAYPVTLVFIRDDQGNIIKKKAPKFGFEGNYYKLQFEKNNCEHLNIVQPSSKNFAILVGAHFGVTLLDIDEGSCLCAQKKVKPVLTFFRLWKKWYRNIRRKRVQNRYS
jgi:hypothetical protein